MDGSLLYTTTLKFPPSPQFFIYSHFISFTQRETNSATFCFKQVLNWLIAGTQMATTFLLRIPIEHVSFLINKRVITLCLLTKVQLCILKHILCLSWNMFWYSRAFFQYCKSTTSCHFPDNRMKPEKNTQEWKQNELRFTGMLYHHDQFLQHGQLEEAALSSNLFICQTKRNSLDAPAQKFFSS